MSDSITIEAVAVVRDGDDGLYLDWLLEGGICALELPGTVLFASVEANDMCDEEGSCEVFSSEDFDAERLRADTAVAEVAALREELEGMKETAALFESEFSKQSDSLTAAEQRNAELVASIVALPEEFKSLSGSENTAGVHACIEYISDWCIEVAQPTESGASE